MNDEYHDELSLDELNESYSNTLSLNVSEPNESDIEGAVPEGEEGYSIPKDEWGELNLETMRFERTPSMLSKASLDEVLVKLAKSKVDDIILQSDEKIFTKLGSDFYPVSSRWLSFTEVGDLLAKITRDSVPGKVRSGKDHNFPYSVPFEDIEDGRTIIRHVRFRGNATACLGTHGSVDGMEITLRRIDPFPKTMDELRVPAGMRELIEADSGIIFVTGETGSGKTTLLGSFIRHKATQPKGLHIVTYEDPIEYDFRAIPDRTSVVAQTSIGEMLPSYNEAVPNALRRNPNIIMIGEVREKVAIDNSLIAAQSGHLVLTTVHTESVAITFSRMVSVFPAGDQRGKIDALIGATRGVIHQRLLRAKDGVGRVPVQEWLELTRDVRTTLFNTPSEKIIPVLQNLVETVGHSLLKDLEAKKELIDPLEYQRTKRGLVQEVANG